MLGLPVSGWLRFFAGAFAAGSVLLLLPFKPMGLLAAFVMGAAAAGLATVALYARSYDPRSWRRLGVRARRRLRAWQRRRDTSQRRARVARDPWSLTRPSRALGGHGNGTPA